MVVLCEGTKLILLGAMLAVGTSYETDGSLARTSRQAHGKGSQHDQSSAETGFLGGGGVENSKYFHYQHLPEHDKYEFGHRRGNEHHVIERYEKAIPHEGQFKTKVRWADKKGGHGEHYWDYNHAGHHNGNGQNDGDGGYSDPVPIYHGKSPKQHQKRGLESERRLTLDDVEPKTRQQEDIETVIGTDIQRDTSKGKRGAEGPSSLFFDLKSGQVVDEMTGKKYILQPIN